MYDTHLGSINDGNNGPFLNCLTRWIGMCRSRTEPVPHSTTSSDSRHAVVSDNTFQQSVQYEQAASQDAHHGREENTTF